MISPDFPEVDLKKLESEISALPTTGSPIRINRHFPCVSCGGSVQPLGRLLWEGACVCSREECRYTPLSSITKIFKTPYGRAIDQHALRIFAKSIEGERILIQRRPVVELARPLIEGLIDLISWQKAYHDYDRISHPDAYAKGAISLVPPRKLDEVLVFRSTHPPEPIDPTRLLDEEVGRSIRRIRELGPGAIEIPF